MKKNQIKIVMFSLMFLFNIQAYADQENMPSILRAYCASDVLKKALNRLGAEPQIENTVIEELNGLADKNRGFNSLYEIKTAGKKAGFKTQALRIYLDRNKKKTPAVCSVSDSEKINLDTLVYLVKDGQLVANITGNRHFCLIEGIDKDKIYVYIPGINHPYVFLSYQQFLATWDRVVLFISKKNVDLKKYEGSFASVSDGDLKNISGAQACGNTSGGGGTYSGNGGSGRWSEGNGSGKNLSDSSNARPESTTTEPVNIRNGNLFMETGDISIPARSLPLRLKRYYNTEIVSEVSGWLPEPGAGSWVIENGEYSGQGDRSVSDVKCSDFTLELDTQTIQPGPHYSWETAWINFRYAENPNDSRKAQNCYYFLIHSDGKIELSKWQNGIQYFLCDGPTSLRAANKNHIKIVALGASIKIYINGALRVDYTDPSPLLSAGRIALQSYFCHAHFDNVVITAATDTYSYDFNQDDNEFIFGYGWTHSYSLKLKEYGTHVTLFRENNSKEIYAPQGNGTYQSVSLNSFSKLSKDAAGFSLKTKYGIHYRFDLQGRLQYVEDRNLNRTVLGYSNIGAKTLLTSITEPAGRMITLQYGPNNMVSRAYDPAGNYLQYSYDSGNQLIKVVDCLGMATNYAYDLSTRNLTSLTDPEGNTYQYFYVYNDRVNSQLDPLGNTTTFDYLWTTVHVINKRGEIYKYNFDGNDFLQSVTDPQNVMERTVNDANGNIIRYYDKNYNLTSYAHDVQGNVTVIQDTKNNLTKFSYDATYNFPTFSIDAKGNLTSFSYDSKGNLVQSVSPEGGVVSYAYNSYGQVASITDPKGNVTTLTYDTYGNLAARMDCFGNATTFTYDILGRLIKVTDALGGSQTAAYDKNNNILSVKDAAGYVTTFAYTPNKNLASKTDPLGNTTSYSYDCFGNLLKVADALGNSTSYAYDTVNQMHFNRADLLTVTDALTNTTAYNYDSLDRLVKMTDAQGRTYQYSYDHQGNLISRIDAGSNTTTYQYDVLNRLGKIIYPDNTSASFVFDAVGNRTQTQDSTGITAYAYDKLNRIKTMVYPDSTTLANLYDPNGNRVSLEITGFGKIFYGYDNLNRLVNLTAPDAKTTQFSYDKLSRRTQVNYFNGALAVYAYDNSSRLTQLSNKDKNSLDISRFTYTYDNLSRRTRTDLINGSINYAYDTLGQLTKESGNLDTKSFSIDYTYDKVGNRLTSTEDNQLITYSYNNLNQLALTSGGAPKLIQVKGTVTEASPFTVKVNGKPAAVSGNQFTADNVSLYPGTNVIKADATDSSGNVGSGQVTVAYNSTSPRALSYVYDKNGNLIQRIAGQNIENFNYDYENRVKTYAGSGSSVIYAYDGLGRRVSKTVNGITTKYYYDSNELVLEKTGSNLVYYIHGPQVDEIISDSRGYCYHYDGLGSVSNVTDNSGVHAATYNYKAFGVVRSQSGSISSQWGFTGRQYDAESGFYYYRNRYYDPRTGRFITRDPIGMVDGPNLYTYCSNNPVNFVDPWGLCKEKKWDKKVNDALDWWMREAVVPCSYGQPMSEWGPNGPTGWGDLMKVTEEAGGAWMWGERITVGTAAVTSAAALGLGIAEMAGLIDTAPQANNIIRIINKVGRWGFRLDKAEVSPPKPIHSHFWRW